MMKIFILAAVVSLALTQGVIPNIRKIGNDLLPSSSGVDVAGSIFLLNDQILGDGVLFAFSAFFRHDTPVRLQIWRPLTADPDPEDDQPFELISELLVIPSVIFAREDVYIESRITEPCVRVRFGDRLGVYFDEAPSAVAYSFDADSPRALGSTVDEAVPVGNLSEFSSLVFPYDFSLAAYFQADVEQYNATENETQFVDCPRGLLVDDFVPISISTTTAEPITGRPGDTGATGPNGEVGATGPMGATGADGDDGAIGSTGASGPRGFDGAVGATGMRGEKGEPGPPGASATGNVTAAALSDDDDDDDVTVLSIILLIWLIIVTILLIILLICLCCAYRRYRRDHKEKPYHPEFYANGAFEASAGTKREKESVKYSTRVPSYLDDQPTWTSTMKSIAESTYSNDTVEAADDGNAPSAEMKHVNETAHATLTSHTSDNSQAGLVTPPVTERQDSALSQESLSNKFAI